MSHTNGNHTVTLSIVVSPAVVENSEKVLSMIFADNPDPESVKLTLSKLTQDRISSMRQVLEAVVTQQEANNEMLFKPDTLEKAKQVITTIKEIELTTVANGNNNSNGDETANAVDNIPFQGEPTPFSYQSTIDENGNVVIQFDTPLSEEELHLQKDATRKRKAEEIYEIVKPKNLKTDRSFNISHLYEWSPKPKQHYIYIKGPDYAPKVIEKMLRDTTVNYGILTYLEEKEDHAIVAVEEISKQLMIMEIIQGSGLQLEVTKSQHRYPIIKFELDFPVTEEQIPEILQEIKDFNLKKYPKHLFEKSRMYKIHGTPFTVVCVKVDPKIRDFIAAEGKGRFFFRNKRNGLLVQDYFDLRKCYDCGRCGHWNCKSRQRSCLRCSGRHIKAVCKAMVPRCPACGGPHEAFNIRCPDMVTEIDRDANNVDYQYYSILWDPRF